MDSGQAYHPTPWATPQQSTGKRVIDRAIGEAQPPQLSCFVRTSFGDHAPRTTGGLLTSDLTITQAVEAELQWEPHVKAAGIGVAAKNGIVTLTGHVATFSSTVATHEPKTQGRC